MKHPRRLTRKFGKVLVGLALALSPGLAVAQADTWATKAPMSAPRMAATGGVINGRLYIAGGHDGANHGGLSVYDPATDGWEAKAPIPIPVTWAAGGVINNRFYVVSGCVISCSNVTNQLQVYDPVTDSWSNAAPIPTPRNSPAAAVIAGKLYVVGGSLSDFSTQPVELDVYDPSSDTWDTKAPIPTPREGARAAVIDGKLYVLGGFVRFTNALTNALEIYDPATNTWASGAPMPTARGSFGVGIIAGKLHAVGGFIPTTSVPTHEVYDPITNSWTTKAPMPTTRGALVADVINFVLYAAGGQLPSGTITGALETYPAFECAPPPSGLVSWWPGDGNANDLTGANHGTLVGGATFAPGFVGQAFSLDGIDDSVSVEDNSSLRFSQFTLSAWINPTRFAPGQGIITKASASGNWVSYMIRLLDGKVNLVVENRAENRSAHWQTPPMVTLNTWVHVAATWQNLNGDITDAKIYVNGVEQPLEMSYNLGYGPTFIPGYTSEPLFIGKQEVPNDGYFGGLIDEAEVYGRVLSPSEIQAIVNAGSAGKCKPTPTPSVMTALGPAQIWVGLKSSDDVGTRFDLLAEVSKNNDLIGSGQVNNVPGGSSGFNSARLDVVNLALTNSPGFGPGDTISIRLSVRIAATGHRSGTARLWFNDFAANSRFAATIGGQENDYFLRNGFTLSTTAGFGPKNTIDVLVDRAVGGNPFKAFGTWSMTF